MEFFFYPGLKPATRRQKKSLKTKRHKSTRINGYSLYCDSIIKKVVKREAKGKRRKARRKSPFMDL